MNEPDRIQAARRQLLQQRLRSGAGVPSAGVEPIGRSTAGKPVPLSVSQRQLWFHMQVHPGSTTYNELCTIRKDGDFDIDAFRNAFNEFVRRHESWRTAFRVIDGEPQQVVEPARDYDLSLLDLSDRPFGQAEREATELAAADTREPYDLAAGHLLRPRLVRLSADHHRLYLGLHHLIFDGVTLYRVLLPELVALYDAFATARPSPLPEPQVQYADYARWEAQWVDGPVVAGRMERWRSRLDDLPPSDLRLDRPRPARQRFAGGMVPLVIDAATRARLRDVSQRQGASLFQAVAAAYSWWLSRYCGHDEVSFATMCDLRQRAEFAAMAGYCLSPVMLRGDLSGEPAFVDLIARMRSEVLDAISDVVPFEHLVRTLGGPRDPRRNPLFQTTLVLEPPTAVPDTEWSVHQMEIGIGNAVGQSKFDLSIELDERPEGHIAGRFIYDADLFERSTAERMAAHFMTVVERAATTPETPLVELDVASDEDRQRINGWTRPLAAPVVTAPAAIRDQATQTPTAVAVVIGEDQLTYQELIERAELVAARLSEAGVGPGDVVGVIIDRCLDLVPAVVGALLAGAAYLPIEPDQPVSRSRFMLADAGARVLLSREALRPTLSEYDLPIVTVDHRAGTHEPRASRSDAIDPADLAYVIYTSGSTGRPKGVQVTHGNLAWLIATLLPEHGFGSQETLLSVSSYAFDASVGDIFGTLAVGGRLVLATARERLDPRALAQLIERTDPALLCATPTTWSMLLDAGWTGSPRLIAAAGAEPLTPALAQRLRPRCRELWNWYGPTETTDIVCCGRVDTDGPITIGRPLPGTRAQLVDPKGSPTPIGVPGELVISGMSVSRGYANREPETQQRFTAGPDGGDRAYRTGDCGRWLDDGRIQLFSRYDEQIKIRGFRVEPGEVETVLHEHPQITAAVVVVIERADGDKQLVGYVVGTPGQPFDETALRTWLRTRVPEYMVPGVIIALPRLPVTAGGKVDRGRLPDPGSARRGQHPIRSMTDLPATQRQLVTLWSELLDHDVDDLDADFFDLGGHSLLAARLILEVRQQLGVDVPLADFLEHGTTIAGLASLIDEPPGSRQTAAAGSEGLDQDAADTLFVVYPDLASAVSLRHLTVAWSTGQPVHPLVLTQRFGRFDKSHSIEARAAEMIQVIRSKQPDGPYALAGYSFGGLIAYEIARSLLATGEAVDWLGVIDARSPSAARQIRPLDPLWKRIWRHLHRSRAERAAKYEMAARHMKVAAGLPVPRRPDDDQFDNRGAHILASRYRQRGIDIPIDLFTTDESVRATGSATLGWAEHHRGPLNVHHVGRDHTDPLGSSGVESLANLIFAALQRARSRG